MNRLFKSGLVTTMIGFIIIIFTATLSWYKGFTYDQIGGWILLALMFLRAKDSLIGIEKNNNE
jgi:hypothetical protein